MYIEFEGVFGTEGCLGVLGDGEPSLALEDDCTGDALWSDEILVTASAFGTGRGGGNGEMDMEVIEAEWAW